MHVAVIGAGNWGKNLVRTFHRLDSLVAVAEVNPVLRQMLGREYPSVTLYDDYVPLLESNIPAVVVATPAHTHFGIVRAALLAGKDVFVEKPFTLSTSEAAELVALADRNQRVLMVGHLLLYQPAVQWIKDYISLGSIGKLCGLHQERVKLGRVRAVENVLWSFGVHDVAVLLYLIGKAPIRVHPVGHCILQKGIEDDVYLHLTFEGGVTAHLHTSWLWPEQRRRLTIVGSKAMLIYDELEQTVTLHRKSIGLDLANRDAGSEVVFKGEGEPLALECEHFLQAIKHRLTPLSDGRSALEVIRVLEKATSLLKGESA